LRKIDDGHEARAKALFSEVRGLLPKMEKKTEGVPVFWFVNEERFRRGWNVLKKDVVMKVATKSVPKFT
jgi:hypothetical protein